MDSAQDIFTSTDCCCRLHDGSALVLSIEMTRPRITADVLQSLERGVEEAERRALPFVITSTGEHFAFGADLGEPIAAAIQGSPAMLEAALSNYQRVMLRLRHASVPTLAAVRGVAVSGGCEVLMHCSRVVAHGRSRIGLLEAAAGFVPGGGGLKEFARRAAESDDLFAHIAGVFETVSTATVAQSAADAQRLGFLTPSDKVDSNAPLDDAIDLARQIHASGFTPPTANPSFRVGGEPLLERLRKAQEEKLGAGVLTPHQFEINTRIAHVLCGGDGSGATRPEEALLDLERRHFIALVAMPLSQERYAHIRSTGKPLSN